MSICVEVRELATGYEGKIVVDGVELEVEEGEILCIVGPNGSGKTTLLRTLAALLRPIKGRVIVIGKDLFSMKPRERARIISTVLTERPDPGLLKVEELVAFGRYPHRSLLERLKEEDMRIVEEALRLVNAENLIGRLFVELSDGEKQKVLIARALAQEPRVLILDEPTTFLDIRHRMEIMTILRDVARRKNMAIIASLHELDIASRFCDQIVVMRNGKIVARGAPEEVLNEDTLRHVYSLETVGVWGRGPLLEIKVDPDPRIFIVAGHGTGAPIYRMLARTGLGFYTGTLYRFDIDHIIATTMNAGVITYDPDNADKCIEEAIIVAEKAEIIVDAGFPREGAYRHNLKILDYCRESGKEIVNTHERPLRDLLRYIKDKVLSRQ